MSTARTRLLIPSMSPSSITFLDALGAEFVDRGYDVVFLPQTREIAAAAEQRSAFADAYQSDLLDHEPERSLLELTDEYDIPSARSFVFSQMTYDYEHSDPPTVAPDARGIRYPAVTSPRDRSSYAPFVEWLHRCLDFFDQLFDDRGGIPVQYQGGEIIRRALDRVADRHGYPSTWMGFSPIPGQSGFYADESSEWASITDASYHDLTDGQRERAREYVEEVRSEKPTVDSYQGDDDPSLLRLYAGGVAQLVRQGLERWPDVRWRLKRKTRRRAMAEYARRRYLSRAESVDAIERDEYVFYPLQYYLESRVSMRAQAFFEQSWLVEYLSRSVPTGQELFVKDHPQQLGAQPRHAVDTIAEYAVPLAPSLHAHHVIENAAAVVTLNNTVGYEALMYGKPVVSLGDAFYNDYTTDIDDINDLDRCVARAIEDGGLDEHDVVEFAHGLLTGSTDGVWHDPSDENVRNVADGYLSVFDE